MSISLSALIITLIVLFFAAFTKAVLGFGEALLAIPLLTFVVGIQIATPLIGLIGASMTVLLMARGWQQIDLAATRQLVLAALAGVPAGIIGLKRLPSEWAVAVLGILLILFGLYNLYKPALTPVSGDHWAYLFGFLSGLFGGAYTMAGPPIIVYGAMRRWPPEQFRGTVQSFFLPVSVMILIGHASAGLWTRDVIGLFVLSLPVLLAAFWIGNRLSDHLPTQLFERAIYIALIVLGVMLLI